MKIWMASRRRMRKNSCEGKARHLTEDAARIALRMSKRTGRYKGAMHTYKCTNCGSYHIGHVSFRTALKWGGLFSKRDWAK